MSLGRIVRVLRSVKDLAEDLIREYLEICSGREIEMSLIDSEFGWMF